MIFDFYYRKTSLELLFVLPKLSIKTSFMDVSRLRQGVYRTPGTPRPPPPPPGNLEKTRGFVDMQGGYGHKKHHSMALCLPNHFNYTTIH